MQRREEEIPRQVEYERVKRQDRMFKAVIFIHELGYWDLIVNTYNIQGYPVALELCKKTFLEETCRDIIAKHFLWLNIIKIIIKKLYYYKISYYLY